MLSNVVFGLVLLVVSKNEGKVTDEEYALMPDLHQYDNYDRCMLMRAGAFYCNIKFQIKPFDKDNPPEEWKIIKKVNEFATNYRHDILRYGVCVSRRCPNVSNTLNDDDPELWRGIQTCYDAKFKSEGYNSTIVDVFCQTNDQKYPIDWLDIVVGIGFSLYIVFVLYATFTEGVARYKSIQEYEQLINTKKGKLMSAFSLTRNWIRLKTVNHTPETEKLRSIQGIRFYNAALVLACHSIVGMASNSFTNTRFTENMHSLVLSRIFLTGAGGLASFFFFSTFLLTKDIFGQFKDQTEKNLSLIWRIIAYRYFRLTPTVLVVVLFHATWLRHLSSGPLWFQSIGAEYQICRLNGWSNLFYIQNWYNSHNMCLPISWTLGLDTQYFILAIFFIWFLQSNEKYFWHILATTLSVVMVATFCQNYYYDFTGMFVPTPDELDVGRNYVQLFQFRYQACSFIGNLSAAIVGVGFGYYFHKNKHNQPDQRLFKTKFRVAMWWFLTFGCFLMLLIIPGYQFLDPDKPHDPVKASLYIAISRPWMAFIVGTWIIGFSEGIGWLALRVVNWPPVYILGRLSYSLYLIHMLIIMPKYSISRYPIYMSSLIGISYFLGDWIISLIAATFLALFFEFPLFQLQKILFSPKHVEKKCMQNLKEE